MYKDDVVKAAAGEIGVREIGNTNWGPRVRQYINALGMDFPLFWCGAFVRWSMLQAAQSLPRHWAVDDKLRVMAVPILADLPAREFGYCPTLGAYADRHDIMESVPQACDIFLLSNGRRFFHTGLVEAVLDGGFVRTIEGNTNEDGSNNGYEVARRTRRVSDRISFVRYQSQMKDGGVACEVAPLADHTQLYLNAQSVGMMTLVDNRNFFPVRLWAKALGLNFAYDAEQQEALLGGQVLDADLMLLDGYHQAPVRSLVKAAGLRLSVSGNKAVVTRSLWGETNSGGNKEHPDGVTP